MISMIIYLVRLQKNYLVYNMFEPILIHNTYSDATNYNFK